MFVRKLVEKASKKRHIGGGISGIRGEDVNPRLTFHYGVPAEASSMAYDPIQHILAISTRNGQIKLFGKDNTQALLQSEEAVPSKFLQFMENQGILLNVTVQNHIEVWDIDKKQLCNMHVFNEDITAFSVVQQSFFIYVGDCLGNISVLKLDLTLNHLIYMQYRIPFSKSHAEAAKETAVTCALPQPMAESKRVLIIFRDGVMSLWGIQESKVVYTAGGNVQHTSLYEPKSVVSACWACAIGSKVVVGYDSGEIFLWAIPLISAEKTALVTNRKESYAAPSVPLFKLNLGYKMDKIPIVSLRWFAGDGRAGRLYVNGFSDRGSSYSFQVIILNDNCESRTIRLMLPLTEACLAMELISCFSDQNKHKENALVLLLKSGHLCLYNDSEIEHYLLKSQSKSSPTLPNQLMVKLPFGDSRITIAKLYTCNPTSSVPMDEGHILSAKKYTRLLSIGMKEKDGSPHFSGFSKTKSLLVTGHRDGAINMWDASCPLLLPILSIKKPSGEDGYSSGAVPVTSLHFDVSSQILVSGDQNGVVCIIIFKREQLASENIFSFLQAKQGDNYTVHVVKVKGAVTTIGVNPDSKHFAIGTEKGFVSIIDKEGTNVLYQKQVPSQHYCGIISFQFKKYCQDGSEKNVLLVGLRDSSVFPLEEDTGNALSINYLHTKKPCKALLMEILDASPDGMWMVEGQDLSTESSFQETAPKQSLLLLCSENTVRLYSLSHAIQGIKKLCCKKKLSRTCRSASVLYGPSSDVGLILVFDCGKIEIRSLPDLTLLKEASIIGSINSSWRSNLNPNVLCSSSDGELVVVNGDQEIFFLTILSQDFYRNLEYINQVYEKDVVALQEGISYLTKTHKEKKKGVLSMIVKDLKGNKTKHCQEIEAEVPSATSEELSEIFSTANFPPDVERRDSLIKDGEDVELDIDDIDLDDTKVKHKGPNFAVLNKQKLGKKFQALKGKLKPKRDEKVISGNYSHEDESVSEIDQIKKKYGFSVSNEASVPKIAESKLRENVRKLQVISDRTSEMQDNAQSFSSLANKVLQAVQRERSK